MANGSKLTSWNRGIPAFVERLKYVNRDTNCFLLVLLISLQVNCILIRFLMQSHLSHIVEMYLKCSASSWLLYNSTVALELVELFYSYFLPFIVYSIKFCRCVVRYLWNCGTEFGEQSIFSRRTAFFGHTLP